MKIYVVTSGEYSDYSVEAVFTDRRKAILYCAAQNAREGNYEQCDIEEFDSADESIDGNFESVVYEYLFQARRSYGQMLYGESRWENERPAYRLGKTGVESDYWKNQYGTEYKNIYVRLKEENLAKALKIARDRLVKINAEESGIA